MEGLGIFFIEVDNHSALDVGHLKGKYTAIGAKAPEYSFHRQELGRLKHIDVAYLWMQDEVRSRRLRVRRVQSEGYVANLVTKPLSKEAISKHCHTLLQRKG